MPHLRAAGAVASLVFLAGCRSTGPPHVAAPGPSAGDAVVEHIVDGDTVDLDLDGREERVRLIGIDTPETKDQDSPVECYGPEATALTEILIPPGTSVRLERDVEARDDYGRLLAYVHRSDGLFVNLELARQGAATVLSIRPNTAYAGTIADAVDEARRAGRGLWGACPAPS